MEPDIQDREFCARCGAWEYWEIVRLLRSYEEDGATLYVYENQCNQCGRVAEYVSENPSALPERVSVREELLAPPTGFDANKNPSSDLVGFSPDKVKDRLATGRQE
jgi:hypothetical protein